MYGIRHSYEILRLSPKLSCLYSRAAKVRILDEYWNAINFREITLTGSNDLFILDTTKKIP
jgi:hypothetical protein